MKKLLLAVLLIALVGCSGGGDKGATGTFTGTAQGMGGDVVATVTLKDGKITAVEFVGDSETDGIADPAFDQMPQKFIDAGNAKVDTVAGATITCNAMIKAVEAAIAESSK